MIKVLYVAHENTKGGATYSLINLLDSLPKDIEAFVLIPKTLSFKDRFSKEKKPLMAAGTLDSELKKRDINFRSAYYFYDNVNFPINILKKLVFKLLRKKELKRIANFITHENIEIIHTNSSVVSFGSDLAEMTNKPHFWHIRENAESMFGFTREDLIEYSNNIITKSDKIIFISGNLKEDFFNLNSKFKLFSEKIEVIYNGIPLYEVNLTKSKDKIFNIFCFGTVYEIKGQEDLIELAKMMRDEKIFNFKISIVGERKEQYYEMLMKKIEEYQIVDFIEFVDYTSDVNSLRNKADLEVVCSRDEAFGRVAVESLRFGNPIIVTNVGGLDEIVEDRINGLKYKPGDIKQLYNCVSMILNNEIDVQLLVDRGRSRAEEFNITNCANNIAQLYRGANAHESGYSFTDL
ncbi:glycosyltransferase family 4 protein [Paenibacillus sp. PDC88]|uniref:glycosyltransferase family 4 protein n=1 Tax=Paenibacillus sp. PDC88 TaxID=1884375 RepID=UPI0008942850|nr:glycosyltransferase family 4 protein [Paenibacillus sp. PDC88]SDX31396.1 Glycosyltransferase involved in cell wall bisynthesis [Paenibacillus sp. PDC88]